MQRRAERNRRRVAHRSPVGREVALRYAPRHSRPPQHSAPRHARPRMARRRSRRYTIIALIVALPAVVTLSAKAFSPKPAGSTGAQGGIGAMLGAYVRSSTSFSAADQQVAFTAFERSAGRRLAIDHFYLPWSSKASGLRWRASWDLDNGRVPMVTFGAGGDTRQVARGDHDAYLSSLAAAVRSLQRPVFLRYAPTPDAAGNASWVHSGGDYVAAWRHVRQIFAGTTAAWVWSPTADAFAGARGGVEQYWPGANAVDWVGAEGFNRYACQGVQGKWREPGDIFRFFYSWGSSKGKPLMISRTGSSEDPAVPRRKGRWFQNATRTLQASMPNVKALVYAESSGGCDWRIGSSNASVERFGKLATDSWFQLPGSTLVTSSTPTTTTASTTRPATTTTRPTPTTTRAEHHGDDRTAPLRRPDGWQAGAELRCPVGLQQRQRQPRSRARAAVRHLPHLSRLGRRLPQRRRAGPRQQGHHPVHQLDAAVLRHEHDRPLAQHRRREQGLADRHDRQQGEVVRAQAVHGLPHRAGAPGGQVRHRGGVRGGLASHPRPVRRQGRDQRCLGLAGDRLQQLVQPLHGWPVPGGRLRRLDRLGPV